MIRSEAIAYRYHFNLIDLGERVLKKYQVTNYNLFGGNRFLTFGGKQIW